MARCTGFPCVEVVSLDAYCAHRARVARATPLHHGAELAYLGGGVVEVGCIAGYCADVVIQVQYLAVIPRNQVPAIVGEVSAPGCASLRYILHYGLGSRIVNLQHLVIASKHEVVS